MAKTEIDPSRAANDAYTGMLSISLIALITGSVFLYLDWIQYDRKPVDKPTAPSIFMKKEEAKVEPPKVEPPKQEEKKAEEKKAEEKK